MPRKDTGRVAILKGFTLRVTYVDGSQGSYSFDYDESELMNTMISGWLLNLDGISHFSVAKEWSEPGEVVKLKVKQNGR